MNNKKNIKKILITGGAGYIGNELIKSLPDFVEVIVVDNFHIDTKHKRLMNEELKKNRKLSLVEANVSDVKKYKRLLKNIDVVIYMASLNSYKESNSDPIQYLTENNMHLQMLLNELKKSSPNIKKMILTSTRGVYGEGPYLCKKCKNRVFPVLSEKLLCTVCSSNQLVPQNINENDLVNPSSYYGVTKKIQEDLLTVFCSMNSISLDIFRIFNVYGENQGRYYSNIGIVPQMFEQIKKKKEIYMSGNGNVTRDFVYVGDIVHVLLISIFSNKKRVNKKEIYNLGSGQAISINDIANFFESLGYKFKRKRIKQYGDIKYSVAHNAKVSKAFNIKSFTDIYSFLNKSYEKVK